MHTSVGVIHGRFQPLHNGHLEYLLAGKIRCDFLYVGIANPDPELTRDCYSNPLRSQPFANPFTYYDRLAMLKETLLEAQVKRTEFEIVPFPINYPDLLRYYVPIDAMFYMTIYDDWGYEKLKILESLNFRVDVMWERKLSDRITSGSEIRELMATNGKWEHLVPRAVSRIIKERSLDTRLVNATTE